MCIIVTVNKHYTEPQHEYRRVNTTTSLDKIHECTDWPGGLFTQTIGQYLSGREVFSKDANDKRRSSWDVCSASRFMIVFGDARYAAKLTETHTTLAAALRVRTSLWVVYAILTAASATQGTGECAHSGPWQSTQSRRVPVWGTWSLGPKSGEPGLGAGQGDVSRS